MSKKKLKNKRNIKNIFGKILLFFVSILFLVSISVLGGFVYLMTEVKLGSTLETRNIAQTSIIYDRTGEHVLYEIHGEENRKIISHSEIPDSIRIATVAIEDGSFYSHHGVDFLAIMRALKTNIENKSASQGASTITQQLARNAFLTREKTLKRKVLEAVYAIKIERRYSKEAILDAYLNEVPYGSNAYGIEAAAQTYFKKSASGLTLDEAALLAAMTKAPTYYSPYGIHQEELAKRQKESLNKIARLNLADQKTVQEALNINTMGKITPANQKIEAPHFVFYVLEELEKKYGREMVEKGGLRIFTTLDTEKQKLAEKVITNNESLLRGYGASNAALVAINPQNGEILTMVGSKNYFDESIDGEVNVATRPRQPGSSFKPIVYAASFEKGFQPETLVLDAKTNFGPDGSGIDYIPNNYSGKFYGVKTMRQSLAMSLNIPAIKTLREVGLDDAIEMAHRLGITTLNERSRYGLALVIGGGEVTLLDETSAFSVFANDGKRNPTKSILKIRSANGNIVSENEKAENIPVIDQEIARKINSILSDNKARTPVFGPNNKLFIPGYAVAAKTGTTQEFRDAWTVGYTPSLAVGVWTGNNDNRPMRYGADGSFVAAPIWHQFMSETLKTYPKETFIAYEKSPSKDPKVKYKLPDFKKKVTYYRASNGEKISEKKAKSMDPKKVRKEIEYITQKDTRDKDKKEFFSTKEKPVF